MAIVPVAIVSVAIVSVVRSAIGPSAGAPETPGGTDAMVRHGTAPYLECSTKGDRRFSAFVARVRSRGGATIETIYQAAKVFADGTTGLGWRDAKGRQPINGDETRVLYAALWNAYIAENPALLPVLVAASGLSDMFGQPGRCCQASELWRIRCAAIAGEAS